MSNRREREERKEPQINKGIEFMLCRRVDKVKPRHGFKLSKTLNLLRRTFHFNLEFGWEVDKPNGEK
jgi:hypothetical protein